jgi:hypothetical protein
MLNKSIKRSLLAILASLSWVACNKEDDPKTRSFYMGFTPFPYEISVAAVNDVYAKLETDADIINHHFDNGVPWVEALNEQPFHQAIADDWNFRKSKTSANHKIYLSVTPLNALRTGLASYRAGEENMALPTPWDTYPFNHVNVRTAYFNYCKRIIDFFKPDYFNMAIEANLLYVNSPEKWSAYLQLHQYVFAQLKFTYPDLPIFSSVSIAYLLPGYIDGNDYVQQRLAALQVLDYSDMYGISFYPYLSSYLGNPYPETTFNAIFPLSQKPIAIAETGYAAQTFSFDLGSGPVTIESDPAKQQKYFKDLLAACEQYHVRFVINFTIRDYDQLWVQSGSPTNIGILWRDTGFYDESGNPRPALSTWKQYLSRKHQEPPI